MPCAALTHPPVELACHGAPHLHALDVGNVPSPVAGSRAKAAHIRRDAAIGQGVPAKHPCWTSLLLFTVAQGLHLACSLGCVLYMMPSLLDQAPSSTQAVAFHIYSTWLPSRRTPCEIQPVGLIQLGPNQEVEVTNQGVLTYQGGCEPQLAVGSDDTDDLVGEDTVMCR